MGNNNQTASALQRFEHNEYKLRLLVFGFCRSIVGVDHFAEHQLLDWNPISGLIMKHYDYMLNSSIRSLSKYLAKRNNIHSHCLTDNYYLWISFEIAQMLIESHDSIRQHFNGAIKPKTLLSALQRNGSLSSESKEESEEKEEALEPTHSNASHSSANFKKLDRYLFTEKRLSCLNISRMDFGRKTYGISKAHSVATYPATTVDNYVFEISGDPSLIYNGRYLRCIYISHTSINDSGEVSCSAFEKNPHKLQFGDDCLDVWVHQDDLVQNPALPKTMLGEDDMFKVPNKSYKYIRCLTRNQYNCSHCYWRLHCLKINNKGKLQASLSKYSHISESNLDEDDNDCIQYLGIVHQWTSRAGGHLSKNELLPQYYEYPCSKSTIWRKIDGVSFISAHIALFSNEFCSRLPSLNNVGRNSNTVKCQLVKSKASVFWNSKCLKNIEKNIDYKENRNEAKLVYYLVCVWLNQLIYKVALDHGFNFKRLDRSYSSPHLYYKQNWNPLSKYLQTALFDARIKYHGKDIYFKNIESGFGSHSHHNPSCVKIADEHHIARTIDNLLHCLRARLQNKHKRNAQWLRELNEIQLTPLYKLNSAKLLKK
mmetsp:Transcript_9052/g.14770  ORF Transcript_9052/g.14770 Transcript_9052/m.14770 type:complete len:596 (-) Transcript_9052:384-2171(-)|eukprot:CAMPEP_0197053744 /NCGR_PEP_ID=MMETSP1384-20130603/27921_1 /TAXON_ID=29189 /ORGANISM="Ammonia sp." /LENGTH=595 /DNA_ID=CAMNT_0042486685 /DNA_START=64 /DNA_END=1851 /DNA_ORIENTATION=-